MATTGGNGGPAPSASAPQGQAQLSVLGQYIKDFSFENPNAPRLDLRQWRRPRSRLGAICGAKLDDVTIARVGPELRALANFAGPPAHRREEDGVREEGYKTRKYKKDCPSAVAT